MERCINVTTFPVKTAEGFEDRKQSIPPYPQIIDEPESYAGNARVDDGPARSTQARTLFREEKQKAINLNNLAMCQHAV